MRTSDQKQGIPIPLISKIPTGKLIKLPPFDSALTKTPYIDLLDSRRSERNYSETPITQEQMAFILWSAQGIQSLLGASRSVALRPAPSAGARHPFELYAAVQNVEGLEKGLYRYAPMENIGEKRVSIEFLNAFDNYRDRIPELLGGQSWTARASVVLFFSCIPYRTEWRYTGMAHKFMLIDLGHAGQNVMLSAKELGLGSCCIAAYNQDLCDEALDFDGTNEYTVYIIPVGVPK